jgi:hypothetical protein
MAAAMMGSTLLAMFGRRHPGIVIAIAVIGIPA